jgi:hypothetical protein
MSKDAVDEAVEQLTAAGLASQGQLKGCSEADIAGLEAKLGVKLPPIYRRFLAVMGRSAGKFLVGTDFLFHDLPTLHQRAERVLEEAGASVVLGPADFVFTIHQGYQFLFFKTGDGPDPEVFLFVEGEDEFQQVADSFSSWLTGCVADEIEAAREAGGV